MPVLDQHTKVSQFSTEKALALRLCETIDTPRALSVAIMLRYEAMEEYLDLSIDPDDYQTARDFACDYLVTEVLRKSPNLPLAVDTRAVAEANFHIAEAQCRETNQRFNPLSSTFAVPTVGTLTGIPYWIGEMRKNLKSILGPLRPKLSGLFEFPSAGKGGDVGLPARGIIPPDKFDGRPSLTPRLFPFRASIMGDTWFLHHVTGPWHVTDWNEFSTVPKDAKKDRGIAKEPRLNLVLQLAIGNAIRRSLRRVGIELDEQQEINRVMAQHAYDCGLATIDLSQASDTLAYSVVTQLFPEDWVHILELGRCDKTLIRSKDECGVHQVCPLEKFSSMGNGYTFELETVLFLAVCRTCIPVSDWGAIAVYGDDIIVPQAYAERVVEALELLGFKVNTEKTCLAGRFFESCGTDWWEGHNVRPFHLKGRSGRIPYELQIANKLRLWAQRLTGGEHCDKQFKQVWKWLEARTPRSFRECSVTPDLGDVGLIRSWPEAEKRRTTSIDLHGTITTEVRAFLAEMKSTNSIGALLSKLSKPAGAYHLVGTVVWSPGLHRTVKARKGDLLYDPDTGMTWAAPDRGDGNAFPARGLLSHKAYRGSITLSVWWQGLQWA